MPKPRASSLPTSAGCLQLQTTPSSGPGGCATTSRVGQRRAGTGGCTERWKIAALGKLEIILKQIERTVKSTAITLRSIRLRIGSLTAWLAKAIAAGGNKIKQRALDAPDLEPLWKQTGEM